MMTSVTIVVNGHEVEVDAYRHYECLLVNLTPHDLDMCGASDYVVPVSGVCCRVVEERSPQQSGPKGLVVDKRYGAVADLPEPVENVIFVVSRPALQALTALGVRRYDVVVPDGFVRRNGKIVGATGFARIT